MARKIDNERYYGKKRDGVNSKRHWDQYEKALLFDSSIKDLDLAYRLGRSLRAIHMMRCREKAKLLATGVL